MIKGGLLLLIDFDFVSTLEIIWVEPDVDDDDEEEDEDVEESDEKASILVFELIWLVVLLLLLFDAKIFLWRLLEILIEVDIFFLCAFIFYLYLIFIINVFLLVLCTIFVILSIFVCDPPASCLPLFLYDVLASIGREEKKP